MKKFGSVWISLAVLFAVIAGSVSAAAPPLAQRFTMIEVDYTGNIGDSKPLSDGLIAFCADDYRMGYLDEAGHTAVEPVFDYAGNFSEGLAPAAMRNCRYGYIDKTGKFAIAPQFDEAEPFSEGLALVRKDSVTGYIDKTGRMVRLGFDAGLTPVSSFSDSVAWVEDINGRRGLIDMSGRLLIDCKYVWTQEFSDSAAWVSDNTGEDFSQIRMGLIDTHGNWLIDPGIYTDAQPFSEGVAWVRKPETEGIFLINQNGEILLSIEDGWMPAQFTGGVSVNVGGDLLCIRDLTKTVIWSSKAYRPAYYGGFSDGKMLVERKADGKHFIMCDTTYQAPEPTPPGQKNWEYVPEVPVNYNFEIVLRTGSNLALVNGEKMQIDPANERVRTQILNDRALLPMRFIVENTPGWSVEYDYLEDCAVLRNIDTTVLVKAQDSRAQVMRYLTEQHWYDQQIKTMDQPPVNMEDRLFLPVRAMAEVMGSNVFWNPCGIVVVSANRQSLTDAEAQSMLKLLENGTV